ncbi:MAG: UDP-N-acetylmuramoyl-tripeptide--D-alanyl-D-alanine ligase [Thermodesulfobacteriota bacterium]
MEVARERRVRSGVAGRGKLKASDGQRQAGFQDASWTLSQVLLATGGRFVAGDTVGHFRRISTDSRAVEPGDLFVALVGDRFDGHAFVAQAVQRGATGVLVSERPVEPLAVPVVQVSDTLRGLGDLAAYHRCRLTDLRVIGITGSCGKTTVKEMTAAIFEQEYSVLKTKGNLNNLIGLPLSLLPADDRHEYAVLEMGMNQPGEIARLTEIADPDIACITNVREVHLEGLGDIGGVARAKGELFAGVKSWGCLAVNMDDSRVRALARRCPQRKITFGRDPRAQVRGIQLRNLGERGMAFTLVIGKHSARVRIQGLGAHNVTNALAAAAMAHAAGIGFPQIVSGLALFKPTDKRLQVQELLGGVRLINDAYNANPTSMLAALETLRRMDRAHRKIAILGDMLELGVKSAAAHRQVGEGAARQGMDYLLAVGNFAGEMVEAARKAGMATDRAIHFDNKNAIARWLRQASQAGRIGAGDWVLLKGSRGMRMETIVQDLGAVREQTAIKA